MRLLFFPPFLSPFSPRAIKIKSRQPPTLSFNEQIIKKIIATDASRVREIMCQLLGSTNKAEVLESMEFFRIAWEYQFDGAEVRLVPIPAP